MGFENLNALLSSVKLDDVTAQSNDKNFSDLPEGYYLCEVEKAELTTSKSSGNPMVAFQFKVVEDGLGVEVKEGRTVFVDLPKTANRKIFKNYVLLTEDDVKKFVSDMLKFEEPSVPDQPILEKEAFLNAEYLEEALAVLETFRLYVQVTSYTKKSTGEKQGWQNLISWKSARELNLPL